MWVRVGRICWVWHPTLQRPPAPGGLQEPLRLTESPARTAALGTCSSASSLASVASSAFAAGSRLSHEPTASSTSRACSTACVLVMLQGPKACAGQTCPTSTAPLTSHPLPGGCEGAAPAQPSELERMEPSRERAWNAAFSAACGVALPSISGARLSAASMADRASSSTPSCRSASLRELSASTWMGTRQPCAGQTCHTLTAPAKPRAARQLQRRGACTAIGAQTHGAKS